jgi:hypothetical protein
VLFRSDSLTYDIVAQGTKGSAVATSTDLAFTPAGTLYVATQDAILRIVPFP